MYFSTRLALHLMLQIFWFEKYHKFIELITNNIIIELS